MKVLLLGGSGYIGSVLQQFIPTQVYDLKGGNDIGDIDTLYPALMEADAVIHLAGFSNDKVVNSNPHDSWNTNYLCNQTIADLLKYSKKRIVFASSCSVYGDSDTSWVDENSSPKPLLMYARAKILSEKCFIHPDINNVVLRFATVYGLSPQMRWDLVVNTMVKSAKEQGKIVVYGGSQWRPVVHVKDVCGAIVWALSEGRSGQVYNVGTTNQNFRIKALAKLIGKILGCPVEVIEQETDQRSYRVNFDKIKDEGFQTIYKVEDVVKEIYESI